MGLIKGGLLVIVSVLLFVVFLAGNVLWTLDNSLDYETIKPELVSIVKETIENEINLSEVIGDEFGEMEVYCLDNSEYVFSYEESGRVFDFPCEVVTQGSDAVVNYAIEDFVEEIYSGQYTPNGVHQGGASSSSSPSMPGDINIEGKESMFDFASLKELVNSYFYIALVVALVLFVLIFFLVEVKSNSFILAGSLLTISSLPLIKIEKFLSWIPFEFGEFFIVFFSEANTVFLISFTTGLIVLVIGIVMKFFGVGFKIFEFFNKFNKKDGKKQIVKKVFVQEKSVSEKPLKSK